MLFCFKSFGGGPGIRTLGGLTPSSVFKTDAFDHSANPPTRRVSYQLVGWCQQLFIICSLKPSLTQLLILSVDGLHNLQFCLDTSNQSG